MGLLLGYKDREELVLQAEEKFLVNVSIVTGKAHFHRLRGDQSIECAQVIGEAYSYVEDMKKTYPEAFEEWKPEEDQLLTEQYKKGIQISELANIHQRTLGRFS